MWRQRMHMEASPMALTDQANERSHQQVTSNFEPSAVDKGMPNCNKFLLWDKVLSRLHEEFVALSVVESALVIPEQ